MPQEERTEEEFTPAATRPVLDGRTGPARCRHVAVRCTRAELAIARAWARRHGLSVSALVRRLLLRHALPAAPGSPPDPATLATVQELTLLRQSLEQACRLLVVLRDHDGSPSPALAATLGGEVAQALVTIDRLQHTLLGATP